MRVPLVLFFLLFIGNEDCYKIIQIIAKRTEIFVLEDCDLSVVSSFELRDTAEWLQQEHTQMRMYGSITRPQSYAGLDVRYVTDAFLFSLSSSGNNMSARFKLMVYSTIHCLICN